MTAASKQTLPAPALSQAAELDRIRFVKATGKCSSLHLADGKTGVCDRLWEMRPATEAELTKLAGRLCKVCVSRVSPKPEKASTATAKPTTPVKVTKTTPSPRQAKTVQGEGAEGQRNQVQLKVARQQRQAVAP